MNPRDVITIYRDVKHKIMELTSFEEGLSFDDDIIPEDILRALAIAATTKEWADLDRRREEGENYCIIDDRKVRLVMQIMKEHEAMRIDDLLRIVERRADDLTAEQYYELRLNNESVRSHLMALWQEDNPLIRDVKINDWLDKYLYETK